MHQAGGIALRVTFCAYDRPGYVGGPNAGLIRLLPELKRRGLDVNCLFLVFGPRHELPTLRAIEAAGVPCRSALYHPTTEMRVRWLLGQIKDAPPDIFVPNLMPAAYFAARWCRRAGIPTIGVLRNVDAFHEGFLEEFAAGDPAFRQTTFVGVSAEAVEMIKKADGSMRRVEQIPSPVRIPPEAVRYTGGEFRVLYSGRMVQSQKRICLTARVLCNLATSLESVSCSLAGHGPDFPKVAQLLAQRGNPENVRLLGRVDSSRMDRLLREHHCLVLLSEYEGLPLAMMEAMAHGLVPIGVRGVRGVEELIRHEETGLLLDDPETDLPAAVQRLRDDPEFFETLSINARTRVLSFSALNVVADKWISLFESIKDAEGPRKKFRMPLLLGLPPLNPKLACEDDRASFCGKLLAGVQAMSHEFVHGEQAQWAAPRCTPSTIDTYTVRRGIVNALRSSLSHFQGLVADIGAGRAPYRQIILTAPRVTGYLALDLAGNPYAPPDVIWDSRALPLLDNAVGTVMATEVLEHCPEPLGLLREAHRILKPGGTCFLTVPFLWPLHDVPHDAFRYTPWTLERLLRQAGFHDIFIQAFGGYEAAMAQMLGLYVRRRSRSGAYTRCIRPALSLAATPVVALLTRLDSPETTFREGFMPTGFCALACKGENN